MELLGATNIQETLLIHGHDEDFEPSPDCNFAPVSFNPGSAEKVRAMKARVEAGLPLHHPEDVVVRPSAANGRAALFAREQPIATPQRARKNCSD